MNSEKNNDFYNMKINIIKNHKSFTFSFSDGSYITATDFNIIFRGVEGYIKIIPLSCFFDLSFEIRSEPNHSYFRINFLFENKNLYFDFPANNIFHDPEYKLHYDKVLLNLIYILNEKIKQFNEIGTYEW